MCYLIEENKVEESKRLARSHGVCKRQSQTQIRISQSLASLQSVSVAITYA